MGPVTSKAQPAQSHDSLAPVRNDRRDLPSPVVFLVLAAIVVAGFYCLAEYGPYRGWVDGAYKSIGLLTHDSDWAFDQKTPIKNPAFRILAVIGPLLTAGTAIYLLTSWRRFFIRCSAFLRVVVFRRKRVALIGLTDNSFALAASLWTTPDPKGKTTVPLIFTDENAGPLVDRCRRHGIAIYPRHAHGWNPFARRWQSEDGVARARPLHPVVNRASDLISFLPTVDAQVDFLVELRGWRGPRGKDRRAWILLEDRGLTQRLQSQHVRYSHRSVTPRLLAISTLAARQLLMSQQFDTLADAFGQSQVHLAIYGMGDLGRAIVKEAAQLYVTRPALRGTKLRITFFDADAQATENALLAEDPGLRNVIILQGHTLDIAAAGLLEKQLDRLPDNVTGHIVTFEDGEAGFSLAVSLRRWLLEPPPHFDPLWLHTHHAAPIFVRAPSWYGLGRLFYTPPSPPQSTPNTTPALSPLPDGIIGFGAIEGLFGAPELGVQQHACLLDTPSELGAKAVHEAYLRKRTDVDVSPTPHEPRAAETVWEDLSPQLRESNFRAFDHIAIKARAIGHRVVAQRKSEPPTPALDSGALETLEQLEHLRYRAERMADGWRFAKRRLDAVCVHPDLVDWADLDPDEKKLDAAQVHALREIAAAAEQRFANALVIGVVGHRPNRLGNDTGPVSAALKTQLGRLIRENSERAPVVLTALAPGADTLAASAAQALHIPYVVPLPLPYELYREDFTGPAELDDFHRLAAAAELHVELPLRFGRASELTTSRQPAPAENERLRACQYALAGAYIVERAHVLIAVSDGAGSRGIGGTHDVLAWWQHGVPEEFATPSHFFVRPPARGAAIIIDTQGAIVEQGVQPLHGDTDPGHKHGLFSHAV